MRWLRFNGRWLFPLLILLMAAYWRADGLTSQSFWNDEGTTLGLIQRDLPAMLEAIAADIHPPGHYLMLKAWVSVAGAHEVGLRIFSVWWGLLAVAVTYALGARLYARPAGWVAGALVAMSSFAVYYSQEARMYAQLAGLSVLSLYLLLVWLQTPLNTKKSSALMLALIGVNALGLYTHYSYPFTLAVGGGAFLAWWIGAKDINKRAWLLRYALISGIIILLFAPWLPTALDQLSNWPSAETDFSFSEKLRLIATTITYGESLETLPLMAFFWPSLFVLSLILPDWYPKRPSNAWRVGLPLLWLIVVCGGLLFSGAFREANLKFLLPAQIALALLIGRGAYLLWDMGAPSPVLVGRFFLRVGVGFGLLAYGLLSYNTLIESKTDPRYWRDDYRGMAAIIEAEAAQNRAVIINAPGQYDAFSYYYPDDGHLYPLPRGYGGDDAATLAEVESIIRRYDDIYVILWGEGERDPNDIVRRTLDDQAYQIRADWFGDVRLLHYGVLASPPPTPQNSLAIDFENGIRLRGYSLSADLRAETRPSLLGVTLYWQTSAAIPQRYKIFVQLLNPSGVLVAQHDSEPANNRALTTDWQMGEVILDNHGLLIPPHLPDGDYLLIVGLYELDFPERRLSLQETGADAFELERIRLE